LLQGQKWQGEPCKQSQVSCLVQQVGIPLCVHFYIIVCRGGNTLKQQKRGFGVVARVWNMHTHTYTHSRTHARMHAISNRLEHKACLRKRQTSQFDLATQRNADKPANTTQRRQTSQFDLATQRNAAQAHSKVHT